MPWMPPEHELSDFQNNLINKCGNLSGLSHWIKGFAGSGKSVLLVYMVQRILAQNPDARVCVSVFTHALKDMIQNGIPTELRDRVKVITNEQFLYENESYEFVALDEVQDIPKSKLIRIKNLADTIVVAGDTDQSIFVDKRSTEEEIIESLNPDVDQLDTIFRLTQKLKEIVCAILPNSRIETAIMGRYDSVQVTLAKANSDYEEIKWVWENCINHGQTGEPAAVLFSRHVEIQNFIQKICEFNKIPSIEFKKEEGVPNYESQKEWSFRVNKIFQEKKVALRFLGNGIGTLDDSEQQPLTYIMTYHSAKGLDFKTVFLPQLNQNRTFWKIQAHIEKDPDIDRRLLFVAATRSRLNLFFSYSSIQPHPYVQDIPNGLLHHVKCRLNEQALENETRAPF